MPTLTGPLLRTDELIHSIHEYLLESLSSDKGPLPLYSRMVAEGATGASSGKGFYDWGERSREELIERRDKQIVRQLEYLRDENAL